MKGLKSFLLTIGFVLLLSIQVFAATNAKIEFSDPTVTRGKKATVSMKVKSTSANLSNVDITLYYDQNALSFSSGTDCEVGAGTIRIKGAGKGKSQKTLEYEIVFDTLIAGKTHISSPTYEVYDISGGLVNITKCGMSTITVRSAKTTSKNANLKSITPSVGEIEPAFANDVLNYSVTVGEDVSVLPISALAEDVDAKVTIAGADQLVVGENKVTITVVAPNGSTKKKYNLVVNKVNGILSSIKTASNDAQSISAGDLVVAILPLPDGENPMGFITTTTQYEGKQLSVLVREGMENDYFLFYGRSSNGDIGYYRYDPNEKTVQKYFEEPSIALLDETEKKFESVFNQYTALSNVATNLQYVVMALGVVSVILLILVIIFARRSSKRGMEYLDEYDDGIDDEDDDDDRYFSKRNREEDDRYDDADDRYDDYEKNDRYARGAKVLDDLHRRREASDDIEDLE